MKQDVAVVVYTTVFAVMFNVMVAASQQWKIFHLRRLSDLWSLRFVSAGVLIVLAPAVFFAFALLAIGKFPHIMNIWHLLSTLYWVTPVFGFQAVWLRLARCCGWVTAPELRSAPVCAWVILSILLGLVPVLWLVLLSVCVR
jgi:hypothetical protein